MILYMTGTITNGEMTDFIPTEISFSNDNCKDDTETSKDCLILSGALCERTFEGFEGGEWASRWKDFDVEYDKVEMELLSVLDIFNIIKDNNMKLTNCDGNLNIIDESEAEYVIINSIMVQGFNGRNSPRIIDFSEFLTKEPIKLV